MVNTFIGTSGWVYPHWREKFYPEDLPQKKWLSFYADHFKTVEINSTFYHQVRPQTFVNWQKQVGTDFVFSVKANRFITHIKRLKECREALANMCKSLLPLVTGPAAFKHVLLFQLPPRFRFNKDIFQQFSLHLQILLRKTNEAIKQLSNIRLAFEFRDPSWFCQKCYEILKQINAALVIADSPSWPLVEEVTADFVYIRFHGRESLYASNYSDRELKDWAQKIKSWQKKGLDVYAYFNNDAMGYAIDNARDLLEFVKGSP